MKLKTVYARFYKSFNFDHLRKAHPDATPHPWESFDGGWFPYVEVAVERLITTVVGANESGKSHLLSAIEKAITGEGFEQRDLCRYSPFFNVERGKGCWPHLGVGWSDVTPDESEAIALAAGLSPTPFHHFLMFREGPDHLSLWIPDTEGGFTEHRVDAATAKTFGAKVLPRPFRIHPDVALPSSVPLAWLTDPSEANAVLASRRERADMLKGGLVLQQMWSEDPNHFTQTAPQLYTRLQPYFGPRSELENDQLKNIRQSLDLARDLLIQLADLDPARLDDLANAILDGQDGHANALVTRINDQLARKLNFPRWWVQDRDFTLKVTPREQDLVFTILDRTGTEYTFNERSAGLKYFLSYLIQSRVHEPQPGRSEILLMDEPDTYLSAEAQQDLLKIFDDFAEPEDGREPVQVIYVTHSPFLIDKNHAERIRVLQKGKGFDGTRVIRNAAQNHYEPLRSAFGAFVGETAFIGACNLLVEGVADQIILSGLARLTRGGAAGETLDLNKLVIVPCGSASQLPYMVYLVRGRDAEKPPVIALLDSDPAGNEAAKLLRAGDKRMRRLIDSRYVLQLGEVGLFPDDAAPAQVEIEDVAPPALALAAANRCLQQLSEFREGKPVTLKLADHQARLATGESAFEALNNAAKAKGVHIEKIPFARALVDLTRQPSQDLAADAEVFVGRMKVLFRKLNEMRRKAERETAKERVGDLVHRHGVLFFRDHAEQATREQAAILLEDIEELLDDGLESDAVRSKLTEIRRAQRLDEEPGEPVPDFESFRAAVGALKDAYRIDRLEV